MPAVQGIDFRVARSLRSSLPHDFPPPALSFHISTAGHTSAQRSIVTPVATSSVKRPSGPAMEGRAQDYQPGIPLIVGHHRSIPGLPGASVYESTAFQANVYCLPRSPLDILYRRSDVRAARDECAAQHEHTLSLPFLLALGSGGVHIGTRRLYDSDRALTTGIARRTIRVELNIHVRGRLASLIRWAVPIFVSPPLSSPHAKAPHRTFDFYVAQEHQLYGMKPPRRRTGAACSCR